MRLVSLVSFATIILAWYRAEFWAICQNALENVFHQPAAAPLVTKEPFFFFLIQYHHGMCLLLVILCEK